MDAKIASFFVGSLWWNESMNISLLSLVLLLILSLLCGTALGFYLGRMTLRRTLTRTSSSSLGFNLDEARSLYDEASSARAQASAALARAERLEEENTELLERARREHDILRALSPLSSQIQLMNEQVKKLENQSLAQNAAFNSQLREQQLAHAELMRSTNALNTALRSERRRGNWGEVELRRVVEASGMLEHVHFDTQLSTGKLSEFGDSLRPDMVIHLPGGAHLAVDSKVPLTSLLEKSEAGEGTSALLAHAKALREHIKTLSARRYHEAFPGSPQLTILFLPAESLLAQALEADPGLLEYALQNHIILCSPTNFLVLLRTASAIWASTQITETAGRILAAGKNLSSALVTFAKHLDKLGSSLTRSVASYNQAIGSLERSVLSSLRKVEELEVPEVSQIDSEKGEIRSIIKAELQETPHEEP